MSAHDANLNSGGKEPGKASVPPECPCGCHFSDFAYRGGAALAEARENIQKLKVRNE